MPPDPIPNTKRQERKEARALTREALGTTRATEVLQVGCAVSILIVMLAIAIALALFILAVGRGSL